MRIQIDPHTLGRAEERGASEEEIRLSLEQGISIIGKKGRLGKSCVFPFNSLWNGKQYEQKKLEVFYVIEDDTVITVTVYVYYGKFEG